MKTNGEKGGYTKALRSPRGLLRSLVLPVFCVTFGAMPAAASDKPVVIELYSSQGCSSCPPADKLLGEIARRPNVVAWTLPVDYWDYNGWKDTYAKPAHTARQKAYSKLRGDSQVYTPQVVINGIAHVVGSDEAAILREAEQCYGKHGAMSVAMTVRDANGTLQVDVGDATAGAPAKANLLMVRVTRSTTISIGRGENSGRTITYTNIARAAARVGEWTGVARRFVIPPETAANPEADGWIMVLQAGEAGAPGVILAAAKAPGF